MVWFVVSAFFPGNNFESCLAAQKETIERTVSFARPPQIRTFKEIFLDECDHYLSLLGIVLEDVCNK